MTITATDLSLLQGLNLPADAIARITGNVQSGLTVIVPTEALTVDGTQTTAWWNVNPTTGEVIAESQNGTYDGLAEGGVAEEAPAPSIAQLRQLQGSYLEPPLSPAQNAESGVNAVIKYFATAPRQPRALRRLTHHRGRVGYARAGIAILRSLIDPPLLPLLSNLQIPYPGNLGTTAAIDQPIAASANRGTLTATVQLSAVTISKSIAASWTTSTKSDFSVSTFNAATATIMDANGNTVGTGVAVLNAASATPATISGSDQYNVNGQGSLSFYGPAESNLGVGGNWTSYSATVTGNVSITLTTGSLMLNGQLLPAGTYTITTTSAALSGSGQTSSPNFAGSVAIAATGGTVELGPGSGTISSGGTPLAATDGRRARWLYGHDQRLGQCERN